MSLQRPQEGKVDACHDGSPCYLVCSCLQKHRSIALRVVGVHVLVQNLVPCVANGAINCETVSAQPQTPARMRPRLRADIRTGARINKLSLLRLDTSRTRLKIDEPGREVLGQWSAPDGAEGVSLYFLSDGISNHEAQQARDCLCFDRICLDLPVVRLPQVPNLHEKNMPT